MKIAVIGAGISGIYSAFHLASSHAVTLYEANQYLGGHTDTHQVMINDKSFSVDTGFIVFNLDNYPLFTEFLKSLGVAYQSSDMSFSVTDHDSGLEYNATNLDKLFSQRKNIANPRFYRMIFDVFRFYSQAKQLLADDDDSLTLGDYLIERKYSKAFIDDHIIPMTSALWSAPSQIALQYPARHLVAFMHNHRMLQISNRPEWLTIKGGSHSYVEAFKANFEGTIHLSTPVQSIKRNSSSIVITTASSIETYDAVIMACHSNQALRLLGEDADENEKDILGAIPYQQNEVVLHSDSNLMPKNQKSWASWNVTKLNEQADQCTVTYWMNSLQNIQSEEPLLVTLNCTDRIDPNKILVKRTYHHPVFIPKSLVAQKRRAEINGRRSTYFVGAYWGWGFHEDGVRSADQVVKQIASQVKGYA